MTPDLQYIQWEQCDGKGSGGFFWYEGASNQTWQSELSASNCNSISLTHPLMIMSSALCAQTLFGATVNLDDVRFIVAYQNKP